MFSTVCAECGNNLLAFNCRESGLIFGFFIMEVYKMYHLKKIIIMAALFISAGLYAVGEAGVPFLTIAPGARSGAMGETGVAYSNNANAIFYNSALLAWQYDPELNPDGYPIEVNVMHAKWLPRFNFNDLFFNYVSARYYVEDVGMLAASLTYLDLGDNQYTSENGDDLGTFPSDELAFSVAYAFFLENNLSMGLNLKYIYSNLAPDDISVGNESGSGRASSFAGDFGILWKPEMLDYDLSVGLNITNIGPAISYIDKDQADPLPTQLKLGVAYDYEIDDFNRILGTYEINRLLVNKEGTEADDVFTAMFYSSWEKISLNRFTHALGLEYAYNDLFFIRSGYFYESEVEGGRNFATLGFGILFEPIKFDFSYIYTLEKEHPLGDTIRLSVGLII
jgi:hypothetical protein